MFLAVHEEIYHIVLFLTPRSPTWLVRIYSMMNSEPFLTRVYELFLADFKPPSIMSKIGVCALGLCALFCKSSPAAEALMRSSPELCSKLVSAFIQGLDSGEYEFVTPGAGGLRCLALASRSSSDPFIILSDESYVCVFCRFIERCAPSYLALHDKQDPSRLIEGLLFLSMAVENSRPLTQLAANTGQTKEILRQLLTSADEVVRTLATRCFSEM